MLQLAEKALALLRSQGLVFLAIVVCFTTWRLSQIDKFQYQNLLLFAEVGAVSLIGFWMHHRLQSLRRGTAAVITKRNYRSILQDWNALGEGFVLLYNVELQSFENEETIQQTWGELESMKNIKGIVLLLSRDKVTRWERIVLREEDRFFAKAENRRFHVCAIEDSPAAATGSDVPGIGFALYRIGDSADEGRLHNDVLTFVLAEPFSLLKPSFVADGQSWWDYHHILHFNGDREMLSGAEHIWLRHYSRNRTRDIDRVLLDVKPLKPTEPIEFLKKLGATAERARELAKHFGDRTRRVAEPRRIPADRAEGTFSIHYDNNETINGRYSGVALNGHQLRPGLVWVGGFTERRAARLPNLFEREFRKEGVVQFYYEVSPAIRNVTLTRYMQDMREVLRYVNSQRDVVDPNGLLLVARSINAHLAALVASEDEYLAMLRGVILVAPVFDVIEMMDNYRARHGMDHVRVDKALRTYPGYSIDRWENEKDGWLEFFGYPVSASILADLARYPAGHFSGEAFKEAIGRISQVCKIAVLSHPEDPITGSATAFAALRRAKSGTGLIREEHFKLIEIESSHLDSILRDRYPFKLRNETRRTRNTLREMLTDCGMPPPPGDTMAERVENLTRNQDLAERIVDMLDASVQARLPEDVRASVLQHLSKVRVSFLKRLRSSLAATVEDSEEEADEA